jgi:hypothetical protein
MHIGVAYKCEFELGFVFVRFCFLNRPEDKRYFPSGEDENPVPLFRIAWEKTEIPIFGDSESAIGNTFQNMFMKYSHLASETPSSVKTTPQPAAIAWLAVPTGL